jgi:hypothetical protein
VFVLYQSVTSHETFDRALLHVPRARDASVRAFLRRPSLSFS